MQIWVDMRQFCNIRAGHRVSAPAWGTKRRLADWIDADFLPMLESAYFLGTASKIMGRIA